jgi:23S rRNA (cytosine1962-C5)-methyltransferase
VRPALRLARPLRDAIGAGHPWVFDRALRPLPAGVEPGDLATLVDERGPLGTALVDPGSPIRARVPDLDPDAVIDAGWLRGRVRAAVAARVGDPTLAGSDGWRLVHGENDRIPGLTVDRYGETAVIVFDGEAATRRWRPLVGAVLDGARDAGLGLRGAWLRDRKTGGGEAVGAVPEEIVIAEGAARYEVVVRRGA